MKESPLKQRVFDQLFQGLALCHLLEGSELLEIATGLRRAETDGDERQLFEAVADAVHAYAMAKAQA